MITIYDDAGNMIGYYDPTNGNGYPLDGSSNADLGLVDSLAQQQWAAQGGAPVDIGAGNYTLSPSTFGYSAPVDTLTANANAIAAAAGLLQTATPGIFKAASGALMRFTPGAAGQGTFTPVSGTGGMSMWLIIALGAAVVLATRSPG